MDVSGKVANKKHPPTNEPHFFKMTTSPAPAAFCYQGSVPKDASFRAMQVSQPALSNRCNALTFTTQYQPTLSNVQFTSQMTSTIIPWTVTAVQNQTDDPDHPIMTTVSIAGNFFGRFTTTGGGAGVYNPSFLIPLPPEFPAAVFPFGSGGYNSVAGCCNAFPSTAPGWSVAPGSVFAPLTTSISFNENYADALFTVAAPGNGSTDVGGTVSFTYNSTSAISPLQLAHYVVAPLN